jgi:hypothetical protein
MHSNVMTADQEVIGQNEGLYGTSKLTYSPIALGLAGQEKLYDVGSLKEKQHSEIHYSLAEEYPADQIAAALKPTMTELAQVTAVSSKFSFCQFAKGVEFKISEIGDKNMQNVEAGINKELWKEWDGAAFKGVSASNQGFAGHSKGVVINAAALTFDTLVSSTTTAINNITAAGDLTSDQYGMITMLHDSRVTAVLRKFEAGSEISNASKFATLFPNLVMVEAPSNVMDGSVGTGESMFVLRDLVTLHRASVPALYGREAGKYGLSQDSLFTYESTAVELEANGAIQEVKFA